MSFPNSLSPSLDRARLRAQVQLSSGKGAAEEGIGLRARKGGVEKPEEGKRWEPREGVEVEEVNQLLHQQGEAMAMLMEEMQAERRDKTHKPPLM